MEGFAAFGIFVTALLVVGLVTGLASAVIIIGNDDTDMFCVAWILSSMVAAAFIALYCMQTLFV